MKMTKTEALITLQDYGDCNGMYDYDRLEHIPDSDRIDIMTRLRLARKTIEEENKKFKGMANTMVHILAGMTTVVAFSLFSHVYQGKTREYFHQHPQERLIDFGLAFVLGGVGSVLIGNKIDAEED